MVPRRSAQLRVRKRAFFHNYYADIAGCGFPGLRMLHNSCAKAKGLNHRFRILADRIASARSVSVVLAWIPFSTFG
jgi:hypothetical protein